MSSMPVTSQQSVLSSLRIDPLLTPNPTEEMASLLAQASIASFGEKIKAKIIWIWKGTLESLSQQSLLISVLVLGTWAVFGFSMAIQAGAVYLLGRVVYVAWKERGSEDLTERNQQLNRQIEEQAATFGARYREMGTSLDALEQANQQLINSADNRAVEIETLHRNHLLSSQENIDLRNQVGAIESLRQSHQLRVEENTQLILEKDQLSRDVDLLRRQAETRVLSHQYEITAMRQDLQLAQRRIEEMRERVQIAERTFTQRAPLNTQEGEPNGDGAFSLGLLGSNHPLQQQLKILSKHL